MSIFSRLRAWLRSLFTRDRMLIRTKNVPTDDRCSMQRFRRIMNDHR